MTEYIKKQDAIDLVSHIKAKADPVKLDYYLGYCEACDMVGQALMDMQPEGFSAAIAIDWMTSIASIAPTLMEKVADDLVLTLDERDLAIRERWKLFEDVPMNPETECMEQEFLGFPAGTHREEIWHWFDERYSKGVYALLYGEDSCPYCSAEWGTCDPVTNRFTMPPHGGIKFCPMCGRNVGKE